jgi:hypothetical protein
MTASESEIQNSQRGMVKHHYQGYVSHTRPLGLLTSFIDFLKRRLGIWVG